MSSSYVAAQQKPVSWMDGDGLMPRPADERELILSTAHCILQLILYVENLHQAHPEVFRCGLAIRDLRCLCRTLLQVSRMRREGPQLSGHTSTQLSASVDKARSVAFQSLSVIGSVNGDYIYSSSNFVGIMACGVLEVLVEINRVLATVPFLLAPVEYVLIYPGDLLISPDHSPDRYHVGSRCVYESPDMIPQTTYLNQHVQVLEHIGMRTGGTSYYDPTFFSRDPPSAREFFTAGRVFAILWDVEESTKEIQDVADEDPSVTHERIHFGILEGIYSGPYTGPTTVRRFIVVRKGTRSCYCLPIYTSNPQRCSDAQNYGVVYTDANPPSAPPEGIKIYQPLRVASLPLRHTVMRNKLLMTDIPPVSELPTRTLPPTARIDYRGLCEVEFNVRSKNIGLVDAEGLGLLEQYTDHHFPVLSGDGFGQNQDIREGDAMDID